MLPYVHLIFLPRLLSVEESKVIDNAHSFPHDIFASIILTVVGVMLGVIASLGMSVPVTVGFLVGTGICMATAITMLRRAMVSRSAYTIMRCIKRGEPIPLMTVDPIVEVAPRLGALFDQYNTIVKDWHVYTNAIKKGQIKEDERLSKIDEEKITLALQQSYAELNAFAQNIEEQLECKKAADDLFALKQRSRNTPSSSHVGTSDALAALRGLDERLREHLSHTTPIDIYAEQLVRPALDEAKLKALEADIAGLHVPRQAQST